MAHLHVLLESIERTLIRAITSGLPIIRGSGTIANNLAKFFARKPRQNVIPEIHGVALGGCWTWVERVFILPNIVTASL